MKVRERGTHKENRQTQKETGDRRKEERARKAAHL